MIEMISADERLSISDIVRLIDIAHETHDSDIKKYVLMTLRSHFDPPLAFIVPISIDIMGKS